MINCCSRSNTDSPPPFFCEPDIALLSLLSIFLKPVMANNEIREVTPLNNRNCVLEEAGDSYNDRVYLDNIIGGVMPC